MFCSNCGFQNVNEVRYCNRCGKQLRSDAVDVSSMSDIITKFLTTIGAVTLAGIGFPMFAMLVLGKRGFSPPVLLVVAVLGFAATVAIDGLLVWLMLRVLRMRQEAPQAFNHERNTNGLSQPNLISQPPFTSVTEHTTRNFDPIHSGSHDR